MECLKVILDEINEEFKTKGEVFVYLMHRDVDLCNQTDRPKGGPRLAS